VPFTGGASPGPERTGGGEGIDSNVPLVQRIYETISRGRGSAYDQSWPPTTAVGIENLATARMLAFDGWGTNQRLANECNPSKATVGGLLPRWEVVLNCPPNYGDTQPVRQARCGAKFALWGKASISQVVLDAITTALGPILVGVVHRDPIGAGAQDALSWWPGIQGVAGAVTSITGGNIVVFQEFEDIFLPTAAPGATLTLANCSNTANNGSFQVKTWISGTTLTFPNPGSPVAPDYGVGGTALLPTVKWSLDSPLTPWMSTVDTIEVQVTATVTGYSNVDGTPNALFYQTVGGMVAVLDGILPAWMAVNWWIASSHGGIGFYLDEQNLDCEAFDV
jgi:hypothetical protein